MPSCCDHDHNKVNQAVQKHHGHGAVVAGGGDKRLMYFGVIALAVIIGGVAWGLWGSGSKSDFDSGRSPTSTGGTAKIVLEPQEWDAENVSMANGKYSKVVVVKNTGDAPLIISGIQTSCMCTTAALRVNNKESEQFGMNMGGHSHGTSGPSPRGWSETIAAGGQGELIVTFDPLAHGPDATGKVVREVYLRTNDPKNQEAVVKFTANVVK